MADIMLHTTNASQVTCVSNIFIDDFMKDANGEYVKIYLYLLRCLGREGYIFSLSEVADRLDHTERDVMKALTYWEKVGLLHLEYDSANELSGICLVDVSGYVTTIAPVTVSAPAPIATPAGAKVAEAVTFKAPERKTYTPEELDIFASQDEVQDLLFAASTYIGRPLSTTESESVLYWYDSLGMDIDLIEYLIESCLDNGHTSFHYMDTVALNWAEEGIKTIEDAKNSARNHSDITFSVMKAFGISNRSLIPTEQALIDKWMSEYGFSLEIICKACEKTVLATNKPSFKYAETILASWKKSNVKTLEDISRLDDKHIATINEAKASKPAVKAVVTKSKSTNAFNNFSQRANANDLDELERAILKK